LFRFLLPELLVPCVEVESDVPAPLLLLPVLLLPVLLLPVLPDCELPVFPDEP